MTVARVLDDNGPRVCFVYGPPGIGKSTLLRAFQAQCVDRGVRVWSVDCAAIDPTEAGFRAGLTAAGYVEGDAGVVVVDTYEVFRIADPWLRHELVPSLPAGVRFVLASRDPPMLEWSVERGRLGGLEVLPLGPLDDDAVSEILTAAGVDDPTTAGQLRRLAGGHPLAACLAAEADAAAMPLETAASRVIETLTGAVRDQLDSADRAVLDAAAVPRRVTRGVLDAMLHDDASDALERLSSMSFVEMTSEGLRLHDAVREALCARLRSLDPGRFRDLRAAAWRHLHAESERAASSELHRTTADLLFLIDNPVVREAMFPSTAHTFSVESMRPGEEEEVSSLWHAHFGPDGAEVLDAWLRLHPQSIRVVHDRSGTLAGCAIVSEWRDIPHALERADPAVAAWSRDAARRPLPPRQRTLVARCHLSRDAGEVPSGPVAAAMLDVKRDYFRLRPHLGRMYIGIRDPAPFLPAFRTLGFESFDEPVLIGDEAVHSVRLDFGPESIDGWLSRIAAAELGIPVSSFLDDSDHSIDLNGRRVQLSPLEFGVMASLAARRGSPVSRADLLDEVWDTTHAGSSNNVDVVIRSLRKKLGPSAELVETVRGVGYRLR